MDKPRISRPEPPTTLPFAREAVHVVCSHRFLTAEQLNRLFGEAANVRPTLSRLVEAGYLAGIKRPVLNREAPDTVYALAQRGADLIASDQGIDRKLVRWKKYHNYVGLLFVEHRLAVNDVHIAFAVGARLHGYRLEEWRYEVPIREDVDDPDELCPPLRLRPDAYFRILAGVRRMHFFLEVDMATESHGKFAGKSRRYLVYKESGLFRIRLGRSFRVLTVAPTVTRVRALKRVTEAQGGQRVFWFARQEDVTAECIDEPVWRLAGEDGTRARLLDLTGGTSVPSRR